jgi:hypothetical protein
MKWTTLMGLALLGFAQFAPQTANAGSAVATDAKGHNVYDFGHPKDTCKRRALEMARHKGWSNVKIVAATDVNGYGAIAIARHPNGHGSILGVVLGQQSAREAATAAVNRCLQAGGTDVKIRWTFKG